MKYYTSDLHFGHKNIIKYEDRPFNSVEEMDEYLIYKWNNKVNKNDEVYILGDFGFVNGTRANELLDRLNGRKFLIRGNHDHSFLKDKSFDKTKFEWIKDYLMTDLQSEFDTIKEVYDNLIRIATYLGNN